MLNRIHSEKNLVKKLSVFFLALSRERPQAGIIACEVGSEFDEGPKSTNGSR